MISHDKGFIYIHIPKTAGTSIEKMLGEHGDTSVRLKQDHRSVRNIEGGIPPWQRVGGGIKGCLIYANQRIQAAMAGLECVNSHQFNSYFKFTFVRNPWDRAYSWYRNVIRDPIHQQRLEIPANITFKEFILEHNDQLYLRPQTEWLIDGSGELAVDFVGKFETLSEDLATIAENLGIENGELPHMLDSGEANYLDAYDSELIEFTSELYKSDMDAFGYSSP